MNRYFSPSLESSFPRVAVFSFCLLGFVALTYQVVFARNLVLLFGLTAPAVATVLAIYFSGLALGGLLFGKIADRTKLDKLSRLYAGLFLFIGMYGLLFPFLFKFLNFSVLAVNKIYPLHFAGFNFFTFLFSFLLLVFPAILIGGGFPIINKLLVREEGEAGKKISFVYFVETLGSVLGATLAGFWLIPTFGNTATIFSAATLAILVGGMLLYLSKLRAKSISAQKEIPVKDFIPDSEPSSGESSGLQSPIFLYALFFTGFLALALEVLYTKTLILFIGSSTYAFSLILITFLLGIALGSWALSFFVDKIRRGYGYFGVFLGLIGFWLFLTYQSFEKIPFWFLQILGSYESFEFGGTLLSQSFITFLVIFPATFLMGIIFPLGIKLAKPSMQELGSGIGKLYFANTFGGVLGSLTAGFLLLPTIGYSRTLTLVMISYLLLGGIFIAREKGLERFIKGALIFFFIFWAALGIFSSSWSKGILTLGTFPYARTYVSFEKESLVDALKSDEIIFYEEGQSNVAVIKRGSDLLLRINGKTDASNSLGDKEAEILIGALPMLFSQNPEEVLVIGLGSGITLGTITQFDEAKNIDVVEIDPAIIKASDYFKADSHDPLTDSRVRTIMADGRNFLSLTEKKYDVISSEPSNLWVSGNAYLFTKEFYELAQSHLKGDGVMLQWLHTYSLDLDSVRSVLKTFSSVFPNTYLFQTMSAGDLLIIGLMKSEPVFDFDLLKKKFSDQKIQKELERIYIFNPYELLPYFIAAGDGFSELIRDSEIHSDARPFLEFSSPKFVYQDTTSKIIKTLADIYQKENLLAETTGGDEDSIKQYFSFTKKLFPFKLLTAEGDLFGAVDAYIEARKEGPSQYLAEAYLLRWCNFVAQITKQERGDDVANQIWEKCGTAFNQILLGEHE